MVITVFTESGSDIERLKETFTICSMYPAPRGQHGGYKVGKGALTVIQVPWKLVKLVIISLEKIGDGARATPYFLTG
jgi:hypothetical protein